MDTNQHSQQRLTAQSTLMLPLTKKKMTNYTQKCCCSLHTNVLLRFLAQSELKQDQPLLDTINIVWGTMGVVLHYRAHMVDIYTSVR